MEGFGFYWIAPRLWRDRNDNDLDVADGELYGRGVSAGDVS